MFIIVYFTPLLKANKRVNQILPRKSLITISCPKCSFDIVTTDIARIYSLIRQ